MREFSPSLASDTQSIPLIGLFTSLCANLGAFERTYHPLSELKRFEPTLYPFFTGLSKIFRILYRILYTILYPTLGPDLYVQFCLILSVIVADCIKFHSEPSVLHDLDRDLS